MSIGFFIKPTDALMWRGGMATNALHQLIHQTRWGKLDYLLVDLPPGTGDIHLSIINELKISGSVIVSTPQQVAVADVVRGVEMFRHPQVNIPVLGVVENMAWFTPEELPNNRYYLFGNGGAARYAEQAGIELVLVSVSKFLINKFASLEAVVVYTAALFFQIFISLFITQLFNSIFSTY